MNTMEQQRYMYKPKIMIHTCPARRWYVDEYLTPSLIEQGMPAEDIEVFEDTAHLGNLYACLASFALCGRRSGGTWHLQDDVIICRDFVERIRAHEKNNDVVTGYYHDEFGPFPNHVGRVPVIFLWQGFPCIRIPNDFAREYAEWVHKEAQYAKEYQHFIANKNGDDTMFRDWLIKYHRGLYVWNVKPNLVDHIDYLIGGSIANRYREKEARAEFFEDLDLIELLKTKLATHAINEV